MIFIVVVEREVDLDLASFELTAAGRRAEKPRRRGCNFLSRARSLFDFAWRACRSWGW